MQVTVGFGDIVPTTQTETIFTIILIYLGVAFTTSAVANLTLLIGSLDAGSAAYVPSTNREGGRECSYFLRAYDDWLHSSMCRGVGTPHLTHDTLTRVWSTIALFTCTCIETPLAQH